MSVKVNFIPRKKYYPNNKRCYVQMNSQGNIFFSTSIPMSRVYQEIEEPKLPAVYDATINFVTTLCKRITQRQKLEFIRNFTTVSFSWQRGALPRKRSKEITKLFNALATCYTEEYSNWYQKQPDSRSSFLMYYEELSPEKAAIFESECSIQGDVIVSKTFINNLYREAQYALTFEKIQMDSRILVPYMNSKKLKLAADKLTAVNNGLQVRQNKYFNKNKEVDCNGLLLQPESVELPF